MATRRDQKGRQLFNAPGPAYDQWGQHVDPAAAWAAALAKYGPEGLYSASDGSIVKNFGTDADPNYLDVGAGPHAQRPRGIMDFLLDNGPLLAGGALVGGAALGALGGGASGAGSVAAESAPTWGVASGAGLPGATGLPGALGSTTIGSGMATLPAGTSAAGLGGGGSHVGIGSTIKNFLLGGDGHKGLDPTTMLLGGLSMLQGNGLPDPYTGATTNPEASLSGALGHTNDLLAALQKRGPARLRMPAPISIQGLPFQIGGGLGTDPSGQGGSFKLPSLYDQPDQAGPSGNPFATAQFGSSPLLKGWADRLTRGK